MPRRPDETTARARTQVFRPVVETLAARGISQAWLAQQVGLTRHRLWNYLHGFDRVPPGFVERVCRFLGIPPSLVTIPEPRDRYIQQPRTRIASTESTEKGQHQDDSRRTATRRTRSTAPATQPVTHHTPRHGAITSGARSRSSRDDASPTSGGRSAADASNGAKRRVASTRRRSGLRDGLAVPGDL